MAYASLIEFAVLLASIVVLVWLSLPKANPVRAPIVRAG